MDRDACGFNTSVHQYLDCAGRAAMSSSRMADNGRTLAFEAWVSRPGFRGSCWVPMESRQKEDEEVSSQATTLQFGSPGKSRGEEYVCPGHPHCEKGKGKDEVKRETVEERKARMEELQEQGLRAEFERLARKAPWNDIHDVMELSLIHI